MQRLSLNFFPATVAWGARKIYFSWRNFRALNALFSFRRFCRSWWGSVCSYERISRCCHINNVKKISSDTLEMSFSLLFSLIAKQLNNLIVFRDSNVIARTEKRRCVNVNTHQSVGCNQKKGDIINMKWCFIKVFACLILIKLLRASTRGFNG